MSKITILTILAGFALAICLAYDETEIHGYHFHTYFLQNNAESTAEALALREAIQAQIDSGFLANCRLNHVNSGPRGPHPVGSYETCCNKTSMSPAISWFMLNHGNLSILLHPLTRLEVLDHTDRCMFLGPRYPLDISVLSEDLEDNVDLCLPIDLQSDAEFELTPPVKLYNESNANIMDTIYEYLNKY